jgi:uncharacterized protein YfiM (DUF2279 family)
VRQLPTSTIAAADDSNVGDDNSGDDINDYFAPSTYLRKAGYPVAVHNAWLDGMSKRNWWRAVEQRQRAR